MSDFEGQVLQLLGDVCRRLDELQAAVERAHAPDLPPLPPREIAVVDALGDALGLGTIKTHEIIALTRQDFGARPALRAALVDLVGPTVNPQRLGLALRTIASQGGRGNRWRLTAPAKNGGQRLWCIGGLR